MTTEPNPNEWVSPAEAAEIAGIDLSTAYLWARKRRVTVRRTPGGRIEILRSSLEPTILPAEAIS